MHWNISTLQRFHVKLCENSVSSLVIDLTAIWDDHLEVRWPRLIRRVSGPQQTWIDDS